MRMLDSNATNNSTISMGSMLGVTANAGPSTAVAGGAGTLNMAIGGGDITSSHGDRLEASSDSAVSSMASEPMSSLSDGEWGDAGSDSAQEYHQKYAQHHNGYHGASAATGASGSGNGDSAGRAIAQKKHHMFGKRYFQEQNTPSGGASKTAGATGGVVVPTGSMKYDYSAYDTVHNQNNAIHQNGHTLGGQLPPTALHHPHHHHQPQLTVDNMKSYQADLNKTSGLQDVKYSCTMDFAYNQHQQQQQQEQPSARMINEYLQHNHTYPLPPHNSGAVPKPQARDKKHSKSSAAHRAAAYASGDEDSSNMTLHEHFTRDEKRAKALGVSII